MRAGEGSTPALMVVTPEAAAASGRSADSVAEPVRAARSRTVAVSAVALAALYVAAVLALALSPLREFADETDNLLGGYLIAHGARLYVDYFSSHMPLLYYLAAIPALFGAATLAQFRVFSEALLVATTLAIVWGFRRRLPLPLLLGWATLAIFGYVLSWGEMLHAGTWAGIGVFVAGLLCYTTPRLAFGPWGKVALSAAVFVAVQSAILAVYPLAVLAACYVVARVREARRGSPGHELREAAILAAIVAAPHLVVLAAFWATGVLPAFLYDAFAFNQQYYSQYIMNASPVGMLHDWEAQYRTYLAINLLRQPFGIEFWLILGNLAAAVIVARSRGLLVGAAYYLFVGLSHIRGDEAYYLTAFFSLVLAAAWGADRLGRLAREGVSRTVGGGWWRRVEVVLSVVALVLVCGFVGRVAPLYLKPAPEFDRIPFLAIVRTITSPGERIVVAPYQPYVYLATGRMPATRYEFWFPWQAIDPKSSGEYFADLEGSQPPVVIFHRYEMLNGQWLTMDWGKDLYAYLQQRYVPVDRDDPVFGDVFVRSDRVATAREALRQAGLYPPAAAGG